MGLLDVFKKKTNNNTIDDLILAEYKQKYFEECKYIWKTYVPKSGQAKTLQGELLREIEKLRCEAQDNGNINWDDDYTYFCDFIVKSISEQSVFSDEEKEDVRKIMQYIQECGLYAKKFKDGKIKEEDSDPNKIAYMEDNLYDIVCDKIGKLQKEHPEPIPYEVNSKIYR